MSDYERDVQETLHPRAMTVILAGLNLQAYSSQDILWPCSQSQFHSCIATLPQKSRKTEPQKDQAWYHRTYLTTLLTFRQWVISLIDFIRQANSLCWSLV